ncbi:MAG: UDP-N-acetylmuramoyl-tripeptide--D-alanyl-D-alanine ligase [bacterium]
MTESPAQCLSISDILAATQGELVSGRKDSPFHGISIDSRTIHPGQLFWTLKGDRFDSHQFTAEVMSRGAIGAVVGRDFSISPPWPQGRILIRVADRLQALQETAGYVRRKIRVPLIAVTGSNGKTSTKEMIASILSGQGRVLKTEGNRNNLIGLPLTLCRLSSDIHSVVLELGMNKYGEIRRLAEICQPDIGVVTNIGPAHLEFFGSLDEISRAKGELFEVMGPDKVAVINADNPYGRNMAHLPDRVITFGLNDQADVRASDIHCTDHLSFTLHLEDESMDIRLPCLGQHNVYNALAAAASARAMNIPLALIQSGLESVRLPPMRMARMEFRQGIMVINDAYNANPASMQLAIETLVQGKSEGRAFLVLGDMLELGEQAEKFHREIGRMIAGCPIEFLFTCGRLAHWIGEEALSGGMKENQVFLDLSHERIAKHLKDLLTKGDSVLVKGSRGAGMERVIELLMGE